MSRPSSDGITDVACWPLSRLPEAVAALAREAGLSRVGAAPMAAMAMRSAAIESHPIGQRVEAAAFDAGIEAKQTETTYAELDALLRGAAPAILVVGTEHDAHVCALLGRVHRGASAVRVLGRDLRAHSVDLQALREAMVAETIPRVARDVEAVLAAANVAPRRAAATRRGLLDEWLAARRIHACWLLRLGPEATAWRQAKQAGIVRRTVFLALLHLGLYGVALQSWLVVGRAAMSEQLDGGRLAGWTLLLLTMLVLQVHVARRQGMLGVEAGALLRRRLMDGALRARIDRARRDGVGQLIGRVVESEAVETFAINGGIGGMFALLELTLAVGVLAVGAGGLLHVAGLVLWTALVLAAAWHCYERRDNWAKIRRDLTHDTVERMVGYRTRLAQEPHEGRHAEEDRLIEQYLGASTQLDRAALWIRLSAGRGWMLVGIVLLVPAVVGGASATSTLVALGGTILAGRALHRFGFALMQLGGAAVAARAVVPVFRDLEPPRFGAAVTAGGSAAPLDAPGEGTLELRNVTFRHQERVEPVLRGYSLRVTRGDRVLVRGPSGSGKSTLCALLAGLRISSSGTILLDGLDLPTLGLDAWRRRVAAAPQFHENFVLTETFAFNLLMGRRWPATNSDLAEAEQVCGELGLGDLIDRMPSGLQQLVGETGWQLSHGERSRLYIARALLQGADIVILDESVAALDPVLLRTTMQCVWRRAPALVMVAHV